MGSFMGCIKVGEYTRGIKERGGQFQKELKPGCHYVPCCFGYQVIGHVSVKIQHNVVRVITMTKVCAFYVHSDPKSMIEVHSYDNQFVGTLLLLLSPLSQFSMTYKLIIKIFIFNLQLSKPLSSIIFIKNSLRRKTFWLLPLTKNSIR